MDSRIRILIAKPGLDGHDLGAKLIARLLRDAGMEVVYTGRQQSPEQIIETAIQEDVQIIGLSYLSGVHLGLTQKIIQLLKERGLDNEFKIIVGGIIPREDVPELEKAGVARVFPSGTPPQEIIACIRSMCA
jgi:methylmalonyl-CoA mutase C-terminal domain/subunit